MINLNEPVKATQGFTEFEKLPDGEYIVEVKEFKAKVRKAHKVYTNEDGVQMCEMEFSKYLEMEKALTPPTADEVCGKITKFINGLGFVEEKIKVIYNSEDKEFYYMSKRTDDVIWYKKIVVAIQTISDTKDRTIFLDVMKLSPHLITMIGKFYESLEGEK